MAGVAEGDPPVCQDWNVPSKGVSDAPSFEQIPIAFLGSGGIHPFSRPSL